MTGDLTMELKQKKVSSTHTLHVGLTAKHFANDA